MIIKTQFHQCSPHWMQNQTYKNERVFRSSAFTCTFCWDILLHVHEKSENKVEKGKKNLSIFHEVLANNISQSTASISEISEISEIAIEHQCKPEKQIFENGRKQPNTAYF